MFGREVAGSDRVQAGDGRARTGATKGTAGGSRPGAGIVAEKARVARELILGAPGPMVWSADVDPSTPPVPVR